MPDGVSADPRRSIEGVERGRGARSGGAGGDRRGASGLLGGPARGVSEQILHAWLRRYEAGGPRRIVVELARGGVAPVPTAHGVSGVDARAGLIERAARRRRRESWRRWERGVPMELWQTAVVGGIATPMGRRPRRWPGRDGSTTVTVQPVRVTGANESTSKATTARRLAAATLPPARVGITSRPTSPPNVPDVPPAQGR